MRRRSGRLAASDQFEASLATAASRALAIPEILEFVIDEAFSWPDARRFRSVNRLFRDTTDIHCVSRTHNADDPYAYEGYETLGNLLLEKNPSLWKHVKTASFEYSFPQVTMQGCARLETLVLDNNAFDSAVRLFTTMPFEMPKLVDLNVLIIVPFDAFLGPDKYSSFLGSLASLRKLSMFLALRENVRRGHLVDFRLPELLSGVGRCINELVLRAGLDIHYTASGLKATLLPFANLQRLNLDLSYYVGKALMKAIPSHIQELTITDGNHENIREVLIGLANPLWLPALRKVPQLREFELEDCGVIQVYRTFQSPTIVERAIVGLEQRGGVTDLEQNKHLLYALASLNNTDDSDTVWSDYSDDDGGWAG